MEHSYGFWQRLRRKTCQSHTFLGLPVYSGILRKKVKFNIDNPSLFCYSKNTEAKMIILNFKGKGAEPRYWFALFYFYLIFV